MTFHPVVDRFPITPILDPLTLILFIGAFVGTALLTTRRPAYAAMLLIAVPPFSFEHAVFGTTISFPKMVLLGALVGMIGRPQRFQSLRDLRVPLLGFALVIVAIALSATGALYRGEVLREALKWIEYTLFFATAAAAFAADPDATLVRRGFMLAILVVCASALADLVRGASSGLWLGGVSIPRIAGVLEGPNQLAGYLEVALAFLAAFHVDTPRRSTAALLALSACTLLLTFSRASIIALVIIAVVLVIFRGRRVARVLAGAVAGIAAGIGAVFALLLGLRNASIADLTIVRASDTTGAGAGGVGSRSELWRAAWYLFRHHPMLGVGAGNYELRLNEASLYGVRTHANSWYLQALAEGGIVLFGATVFFIAVMALQSLRNARRSTWALAAFAATIALAVHQIADYLVFYPKAAEPWIVLCALGALIPTAQTCD